MLTIKPNILSLEFPQVNPPYSHTLEKQGGYFEGGGQLTLGFHLKQKGKSQNLEKQGGVFWGNSID